MLIRICGDVMNKKAIAVIFAIVASVLYAINIPFSKLLLNKIEPTMMASYLYLGAGFGVGMLNIFIKKKQKEDSEKYTKKDLPYLIGMVLLDIIAPILLMFGLLDSASSNASLLNNFEIVCTSFIAMIVFKEVVSKKMWVAIFLITISSFVLSFEDLLTFKLSWGSLLVILATLCWGLENNCTRNLSNKNTYSIVTIKGIFSGLGSLIVALCLNESFSQIKYILIAMLLGFVAYGLSIFFYIKAQGIIGASKTSAYYSVSPFVGTLLLFLVFKEQLSWSYFLGLAIMIVGTIIVVIDTLLESHSHQHQHEITHTHNGVTHTHIITHTHRHNHFLNNNKHAHKHIKLTVQDIN